MSAQGTIPAAVCVFDAYGTLLDVHSAVAKAGQELGEVGARLSELWRQRQLEYTWLRSLMRSHADFARVTADSLDYALAAFGIEDAALRGRLLEAYRTLAPYPEVAETLRRLRGAGLKTAVLSNGTPEMLAEGLENAGIADLVGSILSVEEVGTYKPAAEVYALATRHFVVPARHIAFVSSNAWDAHGAAHFGFRSVWVNRRGLPREHLPGALTAELPDLTTLADLVRP